MRFNVTALPPSGREGDREAVEGARATKNLRLPHRNAFSPTRLRREPPPGGGLTEGASRNAETIRHIIRCPALDAICRRRADKMKNFPVTLEKRGEF